MRCRCWTGRAIVLLGLLPGCSPGAPPAPGERPDLVVITVDTWRHDAAGFTGSGRVETPAIDRLAAAGRTFSFAHAHAVVTLPSHASILTGRYPYEHGIRDNAGYVLDSVTPTAATLLGDAGYRTAAFVSAFPLDRRFGLARGFDEYDDAYDGYAGRSFTPPERPGDETVARALAWWRSHAGAPRFLWVHLFTPHYPYDPGQPWAQRYADEPYFGDVARTDAELAPLIDELMASARSTVVVLTSDHGEGLGEHGEATHGMFAYESTLKVPLVLYAKGVLPPSVDDRPARHVDILPTLLELAGLDVPRGLRGRSLAAPPSGDADSYFEALSPYVNRGWAPLTGVVADRFKAIRLPLAELYDLSVDAREQNNLADSKALQLKSLLDKVPIPDEAGRSAELDPETVARLRSLGYAASTSPTGGLHGPESDPKNLIVYDELLASALSAFREGRTDEAIAAMRRITEEQPRMSLAWAHLAFFYSDLGRVDEAIGVLRTALERGAGNESLRRKLALALARTGRAQEAWEVLAVDSDSNDPETQSALGRVASGRGDAEEAMRRFERALELDPTYPTALMDAGILLMETGSFAEARPRLEAALEQDPFLAEAWNALGVVESQGGAPAAAIDAWRRAVEIDPRLADAWFNLGLMLGRRGDRDGAIDALERYAPLVGGERRAEAQEMLRQLRSAPSR